MEQRIYSVVHEVEDRHWWFRGRRAVIRALLGRVPGASSPGVQILDVGCGTGRNLDLYAELGDVRGVDPSPEAVGFCRRRGHSRTEIGSAAELPFDDASFGLIAATDVLEHVPDERRALAESRRVAADGAILLLTVPAYSWMWSAEDVRLGHHRRYTLQRLREVAESERWHPVFGTYFNSLLLPPIALARKLPRRQARDRSELERTPAIADRLLSLPMRLEARMIGAGIRLPAGVSVGLVCRAGRA